MVDDAELAYRGNTQPGGAEAPTAPPTIERLGAHTPGTLTGHKKSAGRCYGRFRAHFNQEANPGRRIGGDV